MSHFSSLTGFPVSFVKKELLIEDDELSMGELRLTMMHYLENYGRYMTKEENT